MDERPRRLKTLHVVPAWELFYFMRHAFPSSSIGLTTLL
jgi:hypothetical protein